MVMNLENVLIVVPVLLYGSVVLINKEKIAIQQQSRSDL